MAKSLRVLLAPGAGAPTSSPWMQAFARRLGTFATVTLFDYPYQLEGRRAPDRPRVLIDAHRAAFDALVRSGARAPVLIGKSMGGRIGCHVAVESETKPYALVCLGYPLIGQTGARRDQVLLELETRILFVQGTQDALCPLDELEEVRSRMSASSELLVIEGGDHSLSVRRSTLVARAMTQAEVDEGVVTAIRAFLTGAPTL